MDVANQFKLFNEYTTRSNISDIAVSQSSSFLYYGCSDGSIYMADSSSHIASVGEKKVKPKKLKDKNNLNDN